MSKYRILQYGEIIKKDDEVDSCRDGWRDDAVWTPVPKHMVGREASDPSYPSHSKFRRKELAQDEQRGGVMKKRNECTCACHHNFGYTREDGHQCCEPDEVTIKSELSPEWILVSKRLPNDCETVLCYEPNCDENIFTYRLSADIGCSVTHWMPLPKPPKHLNNYSAKEKYNKEGKKEKAPG